MPLPIPTDVDASTAQDTSVSGIMQHRMAQLYINFINQGLQMLHFKWNFQEFCQLLQITVFVGRTTTAIDAVSGEQKLQSGSLQVSDCGALGIDHHAILRLYPTRRDGPICPLNLHEAQSAGSWWMLHAVQIAKVGNIDFII